MLSRAKVYKNVAHSFRKVAYLISQSELQRRINRLPRVKLVNLPTPSENMPRLAELLDGPQLWVKREDCTGLAFGGNTERKAEFALGEALSKKADVVIAIGPVQSNTARAVAAGARKLGLKAILVLTGGKPATMMETCF